MSERGRIEDNQVKPPLFLAKAGQQFETIFAKKLVLVGVETIKTEIFDGVGSGLGRNVATDDLPRAALDRVDRKSPGVGKAIQDVQIARPVLDKPAVFTVVEEQAGLL